VTGYRISAIQITSAQREVLRLLAEGDTDVEIAAQMSITKGTVESHVKALRWALTARNRVHVVARAYQEGLLPTDRRVTV
jgi:DNA-binding NarL/FixJ family response regulator